MATPTMGSWKKLKKLARYLIGKESVVWKFKWQGNPGYAYVATDSDWGGNIKDRKSTSGGIWMMGGALHQNMELHPGSIRPKQCRGRIVCND